MFGHNCKRLQCDFKYYLTGIYGLDEMNLVGDSSNLSEATLKNPNSIINGIKGKNADRLIIAYLNINFIYQKFEALKSLVQNKIDVLITSETKIDHHMNSKLKVLLPLLD